MTLVRIRSKGPYDLCLSLRAAASFSPDPPAEASALRAPLRIEGTPAIVEVRQVKASAAVLEASTSKVVPADALRETTAWILNAELDLGPFYRSVAKDRVLGPLAKRYRGLKPMRPASLFEMAVIAVTEQQISLVAAQRIRGRLVDRFGERVDGARLFPRATVLSRASLPRLRACGLSARKAEYIRGLAKLVMQGSLDLEGLRRLSDDDVRSRMCEIRGFGRWSAEYILIRGLGRLDVVPADDLGVRSVVGKRYGGGRRFTADEVRQALRRYAPYRGLALFYLLVDERLRGGRAARASRFRGAAALPHLSLQKPHGR